MKKNEIEQILKENELNVLKKFGQNFLLDTELAAKTVKYVLSDDSEMIIEIGPGLGALTKHLQGTTKQIELVEIDKGLSKILEDKFPTMLVVNGDFLKYKIPLKRVSFISNIPYYLTTSIIEHVLLDTKELVNFVFMVQKEVITRLCAVKGSKEYGPLSIIIETLGEIKKLNDVTKDKFYPMPHIGSSIFIFSNTKEYENKRDFYRFVKTLFHNRRKTISNNLSIVVNDKKIVNNLLEISEIAPNLRPEQISSQEFALLYENYLKLS